MAMVTASSLVERAWQEERLRQELQQQHQVQEDAERALVSHLEGIATAELAAGSAQTTVLERLQREIRAKRTYASTNWGYFEAANISTESSRAAGSPLDPSLLVN